MLPQSPQCGSASSTKCEATPAAKAGAGRRARAPISAPDRTWLVSSTPLTVCEPGQAIMRGDPAGTAGSVLAAGNAGKQFRFERG